jgi:hypothetical protein
MSLAIASANAHAVNDFPFNRVVYNKRLCQAYPVHKQVLAMVGPNRSPFVSVDAQFYVLMLGQCHWNPAELVRG